jgi:hypothetical protein
MKPDKNHDAICRCLAANTSNVKLQSAGGESGKYTHSVFATIHGAKFYVGLRGSLRLGKTLADSEVVSDDLRKTMLRIGFDIAESKNGHA